MNKKKFYDNHKNFSNRTILEYYISPGIRCKFDLLLENIGLLKRKFNNALDLGCSGNSFLYFLENCERKSFYDLANFPLTQYAKKILRHPICGDLMSLPYRAESFDFISALDVLEHIREDKIAISEISRILKSKGIVLITVPHSMKYYSRQDQLIGHHRRYEIGEIISHFEKNNLKHIRTFGVYGQLMRIADIQSANPEKIEENLSKLRKRYASDAVFRELWNLIVNIGSRVMKFDAKYCSLKKMMNIAVIFIKK